MTGLAGLLTERVALERPDEARDAIGGLSGAWIAAGSVAAACVPAGEGWRVTLRAPSPVAEGWRLVWRGLWRVVRMTADPRLPDRIVLEVTR